MRERKRKHAHVQERNDGGPRRVGRAHRPLHPLVKKIDDAVAPLADRSARVRSTTAVTVTVTMARAIVTVGSRPWKTARPRTWRPIGHQRPEAQRSLSGYVRTARTRTRTRRTLIKVWRLASTPAEPYMGAGRAGMAGLTSETCRPRDATAKSKSQKNK